MLFFYLFMGAAMRAIHDEKGVRYLSFLYLALIFLSGLFFAGGSNILSIAIHSVIVSILIYLWGLLLLRFQDTIFTWIFILLLGTFLINMI